MFSQRNNIRQLFSVTKKLPGNESGVTLLETLVALAILGLVAVAFLSGLTTAARATIIADEQATAESIARSQMEYAKSYTYDSEATTYPTVDTPEGYAVSVEVSSIPSTDADIQKITVTVNRGSKLILTVEGYKVDRLQGG